MADGAMDLKRQARERAYSMPLEEIDVADDELFRTDTFWPYFERLRKEDPVHRAVSPTHGPYWSITKYNDIMAVDTNHQDFSSEHAITIQDPEDDFQTPMFIAMDPPKHDAQRKAVSPALSPANIHELEPLIRERAGLILDSLPDRRDLRLGRQGLHRADHHDAGHPVRLSLRGAPQADPLVAT